MAEQDYHEKAERLHRRELETLHKVSEDPLTYRTIMRPITLWHE